MNRKQLDNYKWKFLRLNRQYIKSYRVLQKVLKRKGIDAAEFSEDFSQSWSLTEPVDPILEEFPKGIKILNGALYFRKLSARDVIDGNALRALVGLGYEKVKHTGVHQLDESKRFVFIGIDLYNFDLKRLSELTELKRQTKSRKGKFINDYDEADLKILVKIARLRFDSPDITTFEIAKKLQIDSLLPSGRSPDSYKKELSEKIRKAQFFVNTAPHCLMEN